MVMVVIGTADELAAVVAASSSATAQQQQIIHNSIPAPPTHHVRLEVDKAAVDVTRRRVTLAVVML